MLHMVGWQATQGNQEKEKDKDKGMEKVSENTKRNRKKGGLAGNPPTRKRIKIKVITLSKQSAFLERRKCDVLNCSNIRSAVKGWQATQQPGKA